MAPPTLLLSFPPTTNIHPPKSHTNKLSSTTTACRMPPAPPLDQLRAEPHFEGSWSLATDVTQRLKKLQHTSNWRWYHHQLAPTSTHACTDRYCYWKGSKRCTCKRLQVAGSSFAPTTSSWAKQWLRPEELETCEENRQTGLPRHETHPLSAPLLTGGSVVQIKG